MNTDNELGIIELYTHGARIIGKDDRVKVACRRVLRNWIVHGEKKSFDANGDSYTETVVTQLYGGVFKNQNDFWFHKGQLREVEAEFLVMGFTLNELEVRIIPTHTPTKIPFKLREGRVLRDYQNNAKDFSLAPVKDGDHFSKLIAMPTGTGKALWEYALVHTEGGGVLHLRDVTVGLPILCPDNQFHEVMGVYDQGYRETVRIVFEDGREVTCDREHIWSYKVNKTDIHYTIDTTAKLIEQGAEYLPLFNPFEHDLTDQDESAIKALKGFFAGHERDLMVDDEGYVVYRNYQNIPSADIRDALRRLGFVSECTDECIIFRSPNIWKILNRRKLNEDDANRVDTSDVIKIVAKIEAGLQPCICISVGHGDDMFICDEFIVTHNTVTSCGTAAENGERWIVGVLPKYADKWAKDVHENIDIDKKRIMVVKKKSELRGVIDMCKTQGTKKLPPILVINLIVLQTFTNDYLENPELCVEDMGCAPWDLMRILDAGIFSVDEVHEHLNRVFLAAMVLHGVKFVTMSGTFRTEDAFEEKVQNTLFPQIKRFTDVKMNKYIDVEFIGYSFDPSVFHKMRYQAFGRSDYNHPTLEKSIMKNPLVLQGYIKMITDLLDHDYIPRREGKRALVFVATVEMADKVILALTMKYPFLKIARYCAAQGDKYENTVLSADLTVSTLQSSGTAVDIPMLISVVCTTMVNSSKTNIQALGRLREIFGQKTTMYMPYCKQISKHLKYMAFRFELFKDITASIKTFIYDRVLCRRY